MSGQTATPPKIVAADYRATRGAQSHWRVDILWRFEQDAGVSVYVLLDQPLATRVSDPLVLDHSSSEPTVPVEANRRQDFEVFEVHASGAIERRLQYNLALPETWREVNVIGRFGYSHTPPDAAWVKSQNRTLAAGWQQVVDSEAFRLKLGA